MGGCRKTIIVKWSNFGSRITTYLLLNVQVGRRIMGKGSVMAISNPDTIELREFKVYDGRKPLRVVELYVDNCRRAAVKQQLNGSVQFHFYPVGSFDWREAKVWLQGLLELSIIAEEMEHGKKTPTKTRRK